VGRQGRDDRAGRHDLLYLHGRPHAPKGAAWEAALDYWRSLASDEGASFDDEISIDASALEPHVTWGTNPGQVAPVTGRVPSPRSDTDERALKYMDLVAGTALADIAIDRVFIGSCTNARIETCARPRALCAASTSIPRCARWSYGIDDGQTGGGRRGSGPGVQGSRVEWRNAGCSMCLA